MRVLATVLVPLVLAGCGGGRGGDSVPRGAPSVTGNGYRLDSLNDPGKPTPSPDKDITVTGVSVLAVDNFDETKNGKSAGNIYVEDLVNPKTTDNLAAGYHGVTVFAPSFNPPTLRVAPGDVVDVRGRYQEFTGPPSGPFDKGDVLPELVGGTISLRFEYHVPDPVTIDVKDLTSYATGRKWIGMLVKLDNVRLIADGASDGSGRFAAQLDVGNGVPLGQVPTLTNALFDLEGSGLPTTQSTVYKSIVGIVQYFYKFSIAPRSAGDLTQ